MRKSQTSLILKVHAHEVNSDLEFEINQIFEISDSNCCEDDTAWGGNCPKWDFDVWKVGVGTVTARVHDLYPNNL